MADVQKENGYTTIANELLEVVVATPLPGRHKDLWWFVVRKTYGYHKKQDKISLSQFVRGTGIDRSGVCKIIKDLVAWKLLAKKGSIYAIIKDYSIWTTQKRKLSSGVQDNRVVAYTPHTKDNIQKKVFTELPKGNRKHFKRKTMFKEQNITIDEEGNILEDEETMARTKASADFKEFHDRYKNLYVKEVDDEENMPKYTIPAVRRAWNKMTKLYSPQEILDLLHSFVESNFYKKTNWSPLTFLSEKVLNQLKNE